MLVVADLKIENRTRLRRAGIAAIGSPLRRSGAQTIGETASRSARLGAVALFGRWKDLAEQEADRRTHRHIGHPRGPGRGRTDATTRIADTPA